MLIAYRMGKDGPEEVGRISNDGKTLTGNVALLYGLRSQMPAESMPTEEDWLKKYGHGSRLWVARPQSLGEQVAKAVSAQTLGE